MKISSRGKNIIQVLALGDQFTTVQSIADQLQVSSRTVLRELATVEKWLATNNFQLETKKGTGLRLALDTDEKARLYYQLKLLKVDKDFTPEQRQTIILGELMLKQKMTKLYYFASLLGVTEGTLSHDLDAVEQWLNRFDIQLERKPGLGIYIEGSEKNIRKAGISLFYENLNESQLHQMFMKSVQSGLIDQHDSDLMIQNRLLNLIDIDIIPFIESFVQQIEEKIQYELADDAFAALVVHMAIAIQRIKNNENILIDQNSLEELKQTPEYIIAAGLIGPIAKAIQVEIPQEEIGYIALHLKGARGRGAVYSNEISMIEDFKLIRLTKDIIRIAEEETGYYLAENEKLLIGMVRHLGPAINRIKNGFDIRNPLQKDIEILYPDLYRIAIKCSSVIEKSEKIIIPDSEIAYIAMHIGAALEHNKRKIFSKVRIAVACASGIAVSRMLSSRLEKEFTNLEIVDIISTINMDEAQLISKGAAGIISTLPIPNATLPVIVVGPFLDSKEQDRIRKFIQHESHSNDSRKIGVKGKAKAFDKLVLLKNYNHKIVEVIGSFRVQNYQGLNSTKQVIQKVSQTYGKDRLTEKTILNDLLKRESQGSTLIESKGMMILHCRSEAVKEMIFSVARMDKPFKNESDDKKKVVIHTVIIMIAPLNESKEGLEILSEITRSIIENDDFSDHLKHGSEEALQTFLSEVLLRFYGHKVESLIE